MYTYIHIEVHTHYTNIYIHTYIYIWYPPRELSTGFGVNPVHSSPDALSPHLSASLKDYSVCVYVYTLNPSMCAELKQHNGC